MVGDAYIVHESNRTVRRVGKNLNVDPSPSGGYSQFNIEHMNKAKIINLVFPSVNTQSKNVRLSCTVCQQHCEVMTKHQLLDYYGNRDNEQTRNSRKRIEETCEDGVSYSMCIQCGKLHSTLDTQIVPKNPKRTEVCIKCMKNPDNMGRLKTLKCEKMNEIRNDPNSAMRWFWSCLCGYRYLMEDSNLTIQVGKEQKSFVRSLESSLDRSRKNLLNKEDVEDIEVGLGGTPASLVDSRDIDPPENY
jgi:hypothetical protein